MTILNWKETLTRILVGLTELDLDKPTLKELNSLLDELKSDDRPDLKERRGFILGNKTIKGILERNSDKLSKIRQRVRELDQKFEDLPSDPEVQKDFDSRARKLFPLFIDDFDVECLDPANYNLRLGNEVYVTTEKFPKKLTETDNTVVIRPG